MLEYTLCQRSPDSPRSFARAGPYLAPRTHVLRVHGGTTAPDSGRARRVLVLARQRTIDQDPAFALRMLVGIAIRGLSPAVNDRTTAVQSIDRITNLLVELYCRTPGPVLMHCSARPHVQGCPRPRATCLAA